MAKYLIHETGMAEVTGVVLVEAASPNDALAAAKSGNETLIGYVINDLDCGRSEVFPAEAVNLPSAMLLWQPDEGIRIADERRRLASLGVPCNEGDAGRHLLAASAQMLAALKLALDDFGADYHGPTIDAMRAAVAKAEGRGC